MNSSQPIFGPPPFVRQNAVQNLNMMPNQPPFGQPQFVHQNKGTNPIITIVIVLIICLIIWLVFLKKDGKLSDWEVGKWDKECKGGKRTKTRKYTLPEWGGSNPEGYDKLIEIEKYDETKECPIDGKFTEWSEWSDCTKDGKIITCGGGTQTRTRSYIKAEYGGIELSEDEQHIISETQLCKTEQCPGEPASVGEWKDIIDSNNKIIYKDNKGKTVNINAINPIDFEKTDFKVYKEEKRTFTKEGNKYKGSITLDKLLTDEKNAKRIIDSDINSIKKNGGGDQIRKIDIDKKDFKFISSLNSWPKFNKCNPEKGRNRWQSRNTTYYFPTGTNNHDGYFAIELGFTPNNWDKISKLEKDKTPLTINDNSETDKIKNKFIFTRDNTTEPKKYKVEHQQICDPIYYTTPENLTKLWQLETIASCTTNFDEKLISDIGGLSLEDYAYSETGQKDLIDKISLWTRAEIIKLSDINTKINRIKQCYGTSNNSPIANVTQTENSTISNKSILYPGLSYSKGTEWTNGVVKLQFQTDDNLVLRGGDGKSIWATTSKTQGKNPTRMAMQLDGNLVIYNTNNSAIWSSGTFGKPGAYAEILSTGEFVIKDSNGEIIKRLLSKTFGDRNVYFSGNKNWKYAKNNSTSGILTDWHYYSKNGTYIESIPSKVIRKNDIQPWGMTENDTSDSERSTSGMITPIKFDTKYLKEPNEIIHVVLLNKFGERIYIKPQVLLDIYKKDDKKNDNETIKCDGKYYNAINSYNIGNYFTDLKTSSNNLTDGLFKNEWGRGPREPYRFRAGDKTADTTTNGAWADPDDRHSNNKSDCSDWYLLAFDGNSQYGMTYKTEKEALTTDGFQKARQDIKHHDNWLRDPRGDSQYSVYWRVYYRTLDDYVKYLNGPNSPNTPSGFTNKSMFNNKCINDLEYFVNYRIKQKNKSNFENKLNNAYLESITY